jgi:chemotaxis-related protein WspB
MSLFLQCQVGGDGYLLDAARIERVLPLTELRPLAHAPRAVRGALVYCGTPVPVIDLSELVRGTPAARCLSTRLILLSFTYAAEATAPAQRLLGVIAEKATALLRWDAAGSGPAAVTTRAAPYLGPIASVDGRLLQRIEVAQLLPAVGLTA